MGILIGLAIFFSILLVLVVLAQNSKGGGLTSQFGGSGASNLIGVKKTGDLLERLTWGFAVAVMVLSLSTSLVGKSTTASPASEIIENAQGQQTTAPAVDLPAATESDSTK
ncbi:MAG: preprotein translocase subunit SecG [Cyclobacteriaceae bacterium]|jgi:preprotein translocase subunit SecG|nr:preprotein translocase subunit SecG [Cyclobacteriaceae bacterium]